MKQLPSRLRVIVRRALIDHELDARSGAWRSPLWSFTRSLHGSLLEGYFSRDVDPVRVWREIVLPELEARLVDNTDLGWGDIYAELNQTLEEPLDEDELEEAFLLAWKQIKVREGLDPLEEAAERAHSKPLVPATRAHSPTGLYSRIVSLAGWLQVVLGHHLAIALPQERIAELLDTKQTSVSRALGNAVGDGYLELLSRGSARTARASVYRFARLSSFPVLEGKPHTPNEQGFYPEVTP